MTRKTSPSFLPVVNRSVRVEQFRVLEYYSEQYWLTDPFETEQFKGRYH